MKAIQSGKSDPHASGMSSERIAMLEEVDFVWSVGRGGGKRRRGKFKPSATWNQRFQELKAYKEEHGDANVPTKYAENPQLGMWVAAQRAQYRVYKKEKEDGVSDLSSGGMNEDRIALLESIGFSFSLAPGWDSSTWNNRLEELKVYKQEHGHCDVPTKDSQLGKWVGNQRSQYALYMKATQAGAVDPPVGGLNAERIAKLEEVGFSWRVGKGRGQPGKDKGEEKVEDMAMAAVAAAAAAAEADDPLLTAPIAAQAEDPTFQALVQSEWNQRIAELKAFKEEHGHLLVPTKYEANPKLGRFVSNQRSQYHSYMKAKEAGKADITTRRLNDERIAELEAIGFVWAAKGRGGEDKNARKRWDQRYAELKAYKAEHGDCKVPTKYPPNPQLARWVGNQRLHYRHYLKAKEEGATEDSLTTGMNDERVALLEEIGFAWSARTSSDGDSWNVRFNELVAYRNEHGNCLVPRNYSANQKLANFVSNQRTHYRLYLKSQEAGNEDVEYTFMTPERVEKLESIGFSWSLRKRRPNSKKDENTSEAEEAPQEPPQQQPPTQAAEEAKVETWEI